MDQAVQLHIIDYLIIILTFMVSLGVGLRFSRRQKTTSHYFMAGGRIPSWAIGMSILATLISSVTFLAYPGEGFTSNWIRLVQGLMVPLVLIFIVWVIVPLFRKVIRLSAMPDNYGLEVSMRQTAGTMKFILGEFFDAKR